MDLYKVKIPLDSYDIVTGTTIINGVSVETGYVELTKTGDTFVNLFLTSDYDDFGIYTDFSDRDILNMVTTIPFETTGTTQNAQVENNEEPCDGELLNIILTGEEDTIVIDWGGPYETTFTAPGGTLCLPIGCYGVRFSSYGYGTYEIKDEYGNVIPIDGAPRIDTEDGGTFGGATLIEGEFCLSCKRGKLDIATYIGSGYTGATAYVMPVTVCDSWTVTGVTSNNMMEIYPIGGRSYLSTTSHARFDANENPIEVTFTYGSPAYPLGTGPTGSTYNIGEGTVKISYNTPDSNNSTNTFSFERECCEECYGLNTKEEMKIGWVFDPKINVNVFIDRGQNSVFDKFLRLSEVSNNEELLDYNNNYFKVNKEQI